MKIGMTSLTLEKESIEEVVKCAKEAGLDGIEWGVSAKHVVLGDELSYRKIKELSCENNLEVFSVGAYCRMTDRDEWEEILSAAHILNAPVIRIWAGEKSPDECSPEYVSRIAANTLLLAEKAKEYHISLGFEYHPQTMTETAESAVALVQRINRFNVGLYWQPNQDETQKKNLRDRNMVLPYCVGNIHIQNYKDGQYNLLEEIIPLLSLYFKDIKERDYNLLIEFVKDSLKENVLKDAETLRKILL